ncbi:chemotaxis protein CheA [Eubacteriales bacterium OttesenSCG-928-A19]|nr:chemotaxis protein CheA [Eubacteriales bacterium OttesenSCG-928-A19]
MADDFQESMMSAFVFEMNTLLGEIEQILLQYEHEPARIVQAIPEIFRIMHTIKGSCAMMSMDGMTSVAHHVEDLFHYLREETPAEMDYAALTDLVLTCVDTLRSDLESPGTLDVQPCVSRVTAFLDSVRRPPEAPLCEYRLTIFFLRNCQAAHLRAFEVFTRLKAIAQVNTAYPESGAENEEQIIREEGFSVELRSKEDIESIIRHIRKSPFVDEIIVHDEYAIVQPEAVHMTPPEEEKPKPQRYTGAHISISVAKLDRLVDLVSEATIALMELAHLLEVRDYEQGRQSLERLERMVLALQEAILSTRMVPVRETFQKMQRIVRDMNKKQNKVTHLKILGEETEVDKNIIDALTAPLVHLIRNAIDHGIEPTQERMERGKPDIGALELSASTEGRNVVITVTDDGRGYDRARILEKAIDSRFITKEEASTLSDKEILSLVLLPGFSTNAQVTEFSGRGVGMDVVYSAVKNLHGKIQIESEPEKGTRTTLKVPLTMAIIDAFLIRAGEYVCVIPVSSAQEVFRARDASSWQLVNGEPTVFLRGVCYPVVDLQAFLGGTEAVDPGRGALIRSRNDAGDFVILVDEIIDRKSIVVKPVPPLFQSIRGVSGCTILGDGSISLILAMDELHDVHRRKGISHGE